METHPLKITKRKSDQESNEQPHIRIRTNDRQASILESPESLTFNDDSAAHLAEPVSYPVPLAWDAGLPATNRYRVRTIPAQVPESYAIPNEDVTREQLSTFENQPPALQAESIQLFGTYSAHQLAKIAHHGPEPGMQVHQPRSESSPSSEPPPRTYSPLEIPNYPPTQPPADQPISASAAQERQADLNLTVNGNPNASGVFEFSPETTLPPADITKPKKKRKQSIPKPPQASVSEDGQPAKKSRSKNGCLMCRQRRVKCDQTHPTCGNCIKGKRECRWPVPKPSQERWLPKPAVQYKNVLPQQPNFPHTVAYPKNQRRWYAPQPQSQFLLNRALMAEPQPAPQEQQAAQHIQQRSANKTMEDGDTRLLHLLRASIQDG